MVYLKVRPYKQGTLAEGVKHCKLLPKYYGPFSILERIGLAAYKLALPTHSKVHPVFHVSLLKKKLGKQAQLDPILPPVNSDGQWVVKPLAILQRRVFKKNNTMAVEVLVQWENTLPSEATWEAWPNFNAQFPTFQSS